MPPKTDLGDDFTFIMTCLKHSEVKIKPDFNEVAKELGAKNSKTCYHRHWRIMNQWSLTGSKASSTSTADKKSSDTLTTRKRKRTGRTGGKEDAKMKGDSEDTDRQSDTDANGGGPVKTLKTQHQMRDEGDRQVKGEAN